MWQWNVAKGTLSDNNGKFTDKGYSGGGGGLYPEAVNNPAFQHVKNVGPLPSGVYVMEEMIPHHPHVGAYAILLKPHPDNKMYGRGGFFIHGDNQHMNQSASDGCIILPLKTRVVLWEGSDHLINVV